MILRVLLTVALLGSCLLTGCDDESDGTESKARDATPAEIRTVPDGTQLISPISNKSVVKSAATPGAVWEGKLYLFCCAVDRDKFKTDPKTHAVGVQVPNGLPVQGSK